jgi:hypothetical protein
MFEGGGTVDGPILGKHGKCFKKMKLVVTCLTEWINIVTSFQDLLDVRLTLFRIVWDSK